MENESGGGWLGCAMRVCREDCQRAGGARGADVGLENYADQLRSKKVTVSGRYRKWRLLLRGRSQFPFVRGGQSETNAFATP
jgi:hypothetical protein